MKKWLRKYVDPLLPLYAVVPVAAALTINNIIYCGTQWITRNRKHWNMETVLDKKIPVIPEFVVIYFFFFLFCVISYIVAAHLGKENLYRLVFADILAKFVCGFFFLVLPTTNVRPVDLGEGFFRDLLRLLYRIDAPVNLFPSIHCLSSWLCFISVRTEKRLPVWYRSAVGVAAVLICFSTLATKQHVLADVAAALVLAEGLYFICLHICRFEKVRKWMELCTKKLFD